MAEGGLRYALRDVDIVAHEHRRPEYLAADPAGRVPALATPGRDTLYETPAITLYLAERRRLTHLAPEVGIPPLNDAAFSGTDWTMLPARVR